MHLLAFLLSVPCGCKRSGRQNQLWWPTALHQACLTWKLETESWKLTRAGPGAAQARQEQPAALDWGGPGLRARQHLCRPGRKVRTPGCMPSSAPAERCRSSPIRVFTPSSLSATMLKHTCEHTGAESRNIPHLPVPQPCPDNGVQVLRKPCEQVQYTNGQPHNPAHMVACTSSPPPPCMTQRPPTGSHFYTRPQPAMLEPTHTLVPPGASTTLGSASSMRPACTGTRPSRSPTTPRTASAKGTGSGSRTTTRPWCLPTATPAPTR